MAEATHTRRDGDSGATAEYPRFAFPNLVPPPNPSPSPSRIRLARTCATLVSPFVFYLAKSLLQAFAFLILSKSIHQLVLCLDSVYDTTGRRARSKFDAISWGRVLFGVLLLGGWHVWMVRMSVQVVVEESGEDGGEEGRVRKMGLSWGRVLGRVLIPAFLVCAAIISSARLAVGLLLQSGVGGEEAREGVR